MKGRCGRAWMVVEGRGRRNGGHGRSWAVAMEDSGSSPWKRWKAVEGRWKAVERREQSMHTESIAKRTSERQMARTLSAMRVAHSRPCASRARYAPPVVSDQSSGTHAPTTFCASLPPADSSSAPPLSPPLPTPPPTAGESSKQSILMPVSMSSAAKTRMSHAKRSSSAAPARERRTRSPSAQAIPSEMAVTWCACASRST